jgi:hypothetical protein
MSPAALAQGSKQTPQLVAARMVRAIERPCRELWPKPFSRLSLTIATAIPAVVDKVMCRIRDHMLRDHENNGQAICSQAICSPSEPVLSQAQAERASSVS